MADSPQAGIANLELEPVVAKTHLLDAAGVKRYVEARRELSSMLGGDQAQWTMKEVGDGNLNFVWIVQGPKGAFVLKQAPPFIRILPDLPLSTERAFYEHSALVTEYKFVPQNVPKPFHFDREKSIIVMEYLSPHSILRKGLIQAIAYPYLADHMATFLAKTLFYTSDIYMKTEEKRRATTLFLPNALVHLTEEPFSTHRPTHNKCTPYALLESEIASIQHDPELKTAVALLKEKFQNLTQALVHGDLHTGSIMVTTDRTQVIDPEFAFYGPMGFDIGALVANLFLSYFSQDGHKQQDELDQKRDQYKDWLLVQIETLWDLFQERFLALWEAEHKGDGFSFCVTAEEKAVAQRTYMHKLWVDTLGFAGIKMMRRIIGVAKVEDFKAIKEDAIRGPCELRALKFGRDLLMRRKSLQLTDVILLAKNV